MNELPLVTVNILSFNRKDELRLTLTKVFEQDYKNTEVIVVDNASSDGSAEMVKEEFPTVQLIQLEKNIGIAGWNEGFKVAKGEYVLVLDDDAYPDIKSIYLAVNEMGKKLNIGVITFNVFNISEDEIISRFPGGWLPNENVDNCYWKYFAGCAFMIRSELYINDLFPSDYFICFHEMPIISYLKQKNQIFLYSKEIKAYHINQKTLIYKPLKEYYHYRNLLNFIIWNISFPMNLFFGMRVSLFFSTRSIYRGWFNLYLNAFLYQRKCLHSYKLDKLSRKEWKDLFSAEFIEMKFLKKFTKYFL